MSYEIYWEPGGVVKHFSGRVSNRELIQSVRDTLDNIRFDSLRYVIYDFEDITKLSSAGSDVDYFTAVDKVHVQSNPNIRIAIVTRTSEIVGLVNEYAKSPLNAYPSETFDTIVDARVWLMSD